MKQTLEDYAASTGKSWRTMLQALGIAERLLLIPQSGTLTLALPENQDTGTTLELYEKPLAGVHCRILSAAHIARLGETPPPWKITTSVDVKSNALPVVCPLDTLANGPSAGLCYGVFVSFGLEDLWVEDKREHATDEDETPADESTPIPEDVPLKILTEWPLDKLEKMFAAMVREGWVAQGAERLVLQRFTDSVFKKPVPPGTPMFDWLDASAKLRTLKLKLDWPSDRMPDHFLLKGKPLKPSTLRSGHNFTDEKHNTAVCQLLESHQL
jgi:hypothetical protein